MTAGPSVPFVVNRERYNANAKVGNNWRWVDSGEGGGQTGCRDKKARNQMRCRPLQRIARWHLFCEVSSSLSSARRNPHLPLALFTFSFSALQLVRSPGHSPQWPLQRLCRWMTRPKSKKLSLPQARRTRLSLLLLPESIKPSPTLLRVYPDLEGI